MTTFLPYPHGSLKGHPQQNVFMQEFSSFQPNLTILSSGHFMTLLLASPICPPLPLFFSLFLSLSLSLHPWTPIYFSLSSVPQRQQRCPKAHSPAMVHKPFISPLSDTWVTDGSGNGLFWQRVSGAWNWENILPETYPEPMAKQKHWDKHHISELLVRTFVHKRMHFSNNAQICLPGRVSVLRGNNVCYDARPFQLAAYSVFKRSNTKIFFIHLAYLQPITLCHVYQLKGICVLIHCYNEDWFRIHALQSRFKRLKISKSNRSGLWWDPISKSI